MNPVHIAVVDDEPDIRRMLVSYFTAHGFRVSELTDGAALFALLAQDPPALVLLDLGLPGEDGLAIARRLRAEWRVGLVIVSGRGEAVDRVVGLEIGADDYVGKPFDLRELVARTRAVLRRLQPDEVAPPAATGGVEVLRFGGWTIDRAGRRLLNPEGQEVTLTGGEFDLLCVFVRHPGRVLSRDFLLDATRGRNAAPSDRTVDVQISRLRRKLEADPATPQLLKSVRGQGYLFALPAGAKP